MNRKRSTILIILALILFLSGAIANQVMNYQVIHTRKLYLTDKEGLNTPAIEYMWRGMYCHAITKNHGVGVECKQECACK